jgi:hypothetical protein
VFDEETMRSITLSRLRVTDPPKSEADLP